MSSLISSGRAAQSMMAAGTLLAAAASIYIINASRRKRSSSRSENHDSAKNSGAVAAADDDGSVGFYEQLGISEENLPSHVLREIHKERQRKAKVELISMKTPMYDNVYMLDRDREPMCTISMKKARWYVRKDIAEWSSFRDGEGTETDCQSAEGDVKCIRLLFEHNGTGGSDRDSSEMLYLRSAKQNICVECGDDGHHIRHYIVPYSYRTLLPQEYKSHMSHDIVILCPDCHLDCERQTKRRMKEMEHELRMKMGGDALDVSQVIDDPHKHHIRSCAIALVKWRDMMPAEKVEGHERVVREYLASLCKKEEERDALLNGTDELTKSRLQKACSINYRVKNPNYVTGSEVVVRSLKDAKAIEEFIIDWRKHFMSTVSPRHMPNGWRVDNPIVCGRSKDGVKGW